MRPQSLKWAVGCRIAAGGKTYGYMGPRAMELLQGVSHAGRGRFLAYTRPRTSRMGRSTLPLGAVDPALRAAALRFAGAMLRRPWELLRPLHLQSLSVVQPVDILPNGEMDTCDGCPNKTYGNERLVAACRGLMVEGFDHGPTIATCYNFEFVPRLVEGAGYTKEVDYVVYRVPVPARLPAAYEVVLRRVETRGSLRAPGV